MLTPTANHAITITLTAIRVQDLPSRESQWRDTHKGQARPLAGRRTPRRERLLARTGIARVTSPDVVEIISVLDRTKISF